MTKIILEGQDALNYIEMLNRIKELEALASKQTVKNNSLEEPDDMLQVQPAWGGPVYRVKLHQDTLSDAIDKAQPQIVTEHKDVPKEFTHVHNDHFEKAIAEEPTPREQWVNIVNTGKGYSGREGKSWLEYEKLALELALEETDPKYYSLTVIATILGRSHDSVKSAVGRIFGYRVKNDMVRLPKNKENK